MEKKKWNLPTNFSREGNGMIKIPDGSCHSEDALKYGMLKVAVWYNNPTESLQIHILQTLILGKSKNKGSSDIKTDSFGQYVKFYIIPDQSKKTKQKTKIKLHDVNTIFDEPFQHAIDRRKLDLLNLYILVCRSGIKKSIIGELTIALCSISDHSKGSAKWHSLKQYQKDRVKRRRKYSKTVKNLSVPNGISRSRLSHSTPSLTRRLSASASTSKLNVSLSADDFFNKLEQSRSRSASPRVSYHSRRSSSNKRSSSMTLHEDMIRKLMKNKYIGSTVNRPRVESDDLLQKTKTFSPSTSPLRQSRSLYSFSNYDKAMSLSLHEDDGSPYEAEGLKRLPGGKFKLQDGSMVAQKSVKEPMLRVSTWYQTNTTMIHVYIFEARNLPIGFAKCHAKVEIFPDPKQTYKKRTCSQRKTANPIFNECFQFTFLKHELHSNKLMLSVWGKKRDRITERSTRLGVVEPISLHKIPKDTIMTKADRWYILRNKMIPVVIKINTSSDGVVVHSLPVSKLVSKKIINMPDINDQSSRLLSVWKRKLTSKRSTSEKKK